MRWGVPLLLVWSAVVQAQVFAIGAGVSTLTNDQGASVAMYQQDAVSRLGVGDVQGFRLGASREVEQGGVHLLLGDSTLNLRLPTDLENTPRVFNVRGMLLRSDNLNSDTLNQAFVGYGGENYGTAFFSTVAAMHELALAELHKSFGAFDLSGLVVDGQRKSFLASASWGPRASTSLAFTSGISNRTLIFRSSLRHTAASWRVAVSYYGGALQLEPEILLDQTNLERIGLNLLVSKQFGRWLSLDAARNEYDTAALASQSQKTGVSAPRSDLLEGGAFAKFGRFDAGIRALESNSGPGRGSGEAFLARWTSRRWAINSSLDRSSVTNPLSGRALSRTASVDSSQRVTQRLRVEEGTTFGGGSPTVGGGGYYEAQWGSIGVTHQEIYVPFGIQSGFHRVLALSLRFHVRDSEFGIEQTSGGGLPSQYALTGNSYLSRDAGGGDAPSMPRVRALPKYAITGRVVSKDEQVISGAAVTVGGETAYTNSEGEFMVRLRRNSPVRVALSPSDFVSLEQYCAISPAMLVAPRSAETEPLIFHVERCTERRLVSEPQELSVHEVQVKAGAIQRVASRFGGLLALMVKPMRP